jgi:hypothetical protein
VFFKEDYSASDNCTAGDTIFPRDCLLYYFPMGFFKEEHYNIEQLGIVYYSASDNCTASDNAVSSVVH